MNRPAPTATDNIETSGFETHLLECYLFVDDYLQSHPKVAVESILLCKSPGPLEDEKGPRAALGLKPTRQS
ncbi:hypothetical protein, partial [Salinibacter ruber]|uniref:hypothetical protein n=1 Tax=Salinibacter ruber TaxID=146919 RepID=UPI002169A86A